MMFSASKRYLLSGSIPIIDKNQRLVPMAAAVAKNYLCLSSRSVRISQAPGIFIASPLRNEEPQGILFN